MVIRSGVQERAETWTRWVLVARGEFEAAMRSAGYLTEDIEEFVADTFGMRTRNSRGAGSQFGAEPCIRVTRSRVLVTQRWGYDV